MNLAAFDADSCAIPSISFRSGNEIDNYDLPVPFDAELDRFTERYLQKYHWGIAHLDPLSWRHYLPRLIEYSLVHKNDGGDLVIEAALCSLRPPDRNPPRLGSLTPEQEKVIVEFLDEMAFSEESAWHDLAQQVLEEYWAPGALYRPG